MAVLRHQMPNALPTPAFDDPKHHLRLYQGDCLDLLAAIPASSVDLVFRRPALLPLQRRHHLPRRKNGFRPQRRLGQIPRPRIQS